MPGEHLDEMAVVCLERTGGHLGSFVVVLELPSERGQSVVGAHLVDIDCDRLVFDERQDLLERDFELFVWV